MSETPTATKTVTKIVRRRPRDRFALPTGYLQTGMIIVSLILSGVVAWKVFFPKKTANIDQAMYDQQMAMLRQQQMQQPLPEELVQEPPVFQHPIIPSFENGNGHGNGHAAYTPQVRGPAISSNAEKMIMDESLKRIPMYHDVSTNPNQLPQAPLNAAQMQNQARQNISVYQYKIPSAPQLGQQQQHQQMQPPGQQVQGSDIF